MKSLMLDHHAKAREVQEVLQKIGYGDVPVLQKLFNPETVLMIWHYLHGRAEIKMIEDIIDLDHEPSLPLGGFKLAGEESQVPHRVRGFWKFDPTRMSAHFVPRQLSEAVEGSSILAGGLGSVAVYPVQVREFLMKEENRKKVPEFMKDGRRYHFWGTIFENGGMRHVPYAKWDEIEETLLPGLTCLNFGFDEKYPALVDPNNLLELSMPEHQYTETSNRGKASVN